MIVFAASLSVLPAQAVDHAGILLILCGLGIGCAAVYPYISYLLAIRRLSVVASPELREFPSISVVVNAYMEGDLVRTRIEDILRADYPTGKITLYVINDGADPTTSAAAKKALGNSPVKAVIIEPSQRFGKTKCQNLVLSRITDEIVIFTDADITTKPDTLTKLVARLQDTEIGAVCADLIPIGSSRRVAGLEEAYRSVYGKMCEHDSKIDSTYNFNGPLIAFKKSAVPHIEETIGADDANLALACIANGYRAVYAGDAVAYELQPMSFSSQYYQKIRRADGLVNSTRLYSHAICSQTGRPVFWRCVFPLRRWMLLYSPVLFVVSVVLLMVGLSLWSTTYGVALLLFVIFVLLFSVAKSDNLLSSFTLNQIYLIIGLAKRKNIQLWDRIEK
ncbi:MAG: glycosyltransferase [Methanocalculaceae archaeon]|jgi:cellulose synthase/poly-beta-1,6-N-acetylglucosamine synthase-like glycosyltransferase|nr:glycosyltransferase [Methanocalculaceae archaeon]